VSPSLEIAGDGTINMMAEHEKQLLYCFQNGGIVQTHPLVSFDT
jgi:hypothetical protein